MDVAAQLRRASAVAPIAGAALQGFSARRKLLKGGTVITPDKVTCPGIFGPTNS